MSTNVFNYYYMCKKLLKQSFKTIVYNEEEGIHSLVIEYTYMGGFLTPLFVTISLLLHITFFNIYLIYSIYLFAFALASSHLSLFRTCDLVRG